MSRKRKKPQKWGKSIVESMEHIEAQAMANYRAKRAMESALATPLVLTRANFAAVAQRALDEMDFH